jgi:hypothetical protein
MSIPTDDLKVRNLMPRVRNSRRIHRKAVVAAEVGNQVERVDRWVVVDLADPADPVDLVAIVNLERRALLSRSLM